MATYQGEPVAREIKRHQKDDSNLWPYARVADEIHLWFDRADHDFDLRLPTPVIAIEPLPYRIIATYRLGRSGIGARTTITFNEGHLLCRPFADTIATNVHEAVHAFEEWHCGRERGGWYHSVAWRTKMAEIGIDADDHGHHLLVRSSFRAWLARYEVPELRALLPNSFPLTTVGPPTKRRQMPKWVCACPTGNPARAVYLNAVCQDCGQPYRTGQP